MGASTRGWNGYSGVMFLPVLLAACRSPTPNNDPAVVVVVLDGVRIEDSLDDPVTSVTGEHPWELLPAVWSELVPQGARATMALNIGITITVPGHAELLTGHRLPLANYPNTGVGVYRPELPTIAEAIRQDLALPAEQVVVMGNTSLIEPITHSLWPGASILGAEYQFVHEEDNPSRPAVLDGRVLNALQQRMEDTAPRFALVNLHGMDRAGHSGDADEYVERIRGNDQGLVDLWQAMARDPDYENGYLILVADHGRHRESESEPVWRHHGDACMGCRHVPMLILGPDVAEGTSDVPVLLSDIAATVSEIMGVSMPFSTGRPLDEMFSVDLGAPPTGTLSVAAANGHLAQSILINEPAQRSVINVNSDELSDPYAFAAEAPVMVADGASTWLCFREIVVDFDMEEAPWQPRCFWHSGSLDGWLPLPAPVEAVNPFWRPALMPDGEGGLVAAWNDNVGGHISTRDNDGFVGMTVGHYTPTEGWTLTQPINALSFPMSPALLDVDGTTLAAIAAAPAARSGMNRQIFTVTNPLDIDLSQQGSATLLPLQGDSAHWRLERPALSWDGEQYWMAALGHRSDGTIVAMATSSNGLSWSAQHAVTADGIAPFPHIHPQWVDWGDEPVVLFAAQQDGSASICHAHRDGDVGCMPTGHALVRDLTDDGEHVYAVVGDDTGWVVEHWPLADVLR